jgi:hypothetical protein
MLALLPHLNFSTDAAILLTIVAVMLGGIVLGQHRVKTFALSVYVGIVLATQLGDPVFGFLAGRGLTLGTLIGVAKVRMALLALPIILLELGHNKQHSGHRRGMILTMILSVMTAALLISTVISLIEPDIRQTVLDGSSLASIFYGLRLWWIGLVPVVAIAESFMKSKKER